MSAEGHHTAAQIRSRLDHPVIDGDGHWVEFDPVFSERMRKVGGDKAAEGFLAAMKITHDALSMSVAERRRRRVGQPGFWTRQAENTLDRATAMMPRLLHERLPEFGADFAIIYPTAGLRLPRIGDDATRRAVIRAHNIVTADAFHNLGDRMTPAAIIPMHTPEEAIAELEYVTRELGAKVGMFGSGMSRRLATATQTDPDAARLAAWHDVLALEGGVGWACQLFGDLLEHWERRSARALKRMDPRKLDPKLLMSLAEKYGDSDVVAALHARNGWPDHDPGLTGGVADLDDFSACKITRKQDWIDLYVKPFYFGCEADDRANAWAFSKNNPFESKLNALYSSDIGHFDVIDMRDPLAEAHELVDDGLITAGNFRDFTFANAVHLWGTQNPRFFEGTAVARAAAE